MGPHSRPRILAVAFLCLGTPARGYHKFKKRPGGAATQLGRFGEDADARVCQQRDDAVVNDFLWEVAGGSRSEALNERWHRFQGEILGKLRRSLPQPSRAFKTLVVMPVRNSEVAVADFRSNQLRLLNNTSGDRFEFALFHYDSGNSAWANKSWYKNGTTIVHKQVGEFCKGHVWSQVTPEWAKHYDYIWLMDGDLSLDFFSWDLYRTVVAGTDPLVSQPAVLPKGPWERSTDIPVLRMVARQANVFPVAIEVPRSESMAPLISTRLWPAVHARLLSSDKRSIWYDNYMWDTAAFLSALQCGKPGILMINASPVRHLNCHDLMKFDAKKRNVTELCFWGCGEHKENCQHLSGGEISLMREGLTNYCDISARHELQCNNTFEHCFQGIIKQVRRKELVDVGAEKIMTARTHCKYDNALHTTQQWYSCIFDYTMSVTEMLRSVGAEP